MSVCAYGCVVRGEHVAGCPGVDEAGRECPGCLPRAAEAGVLCSRCWGRLQSAVRTMPSLLEQLWVVAGPGGGAAAPGGGRRPPGPGCLYPAALGAADDLVAVLWSWCEMVAVYQGVPAPLPRGLWSTDRRAGDIEVVGVRDPRAVASLVAWLSPRLEWCASRPWAGDMVGDLCPLAERAWGRWGSEEPDRRVRDVRCPSCGALSLVVRPPRVVGAPLRVECCRTGCGARLGEDEWDRARAWALVVARMGQDGEGDGAGGR